MSYNRHNSDSSDDGRNRGRRLSTSDKYNGRNARRDDSSGSPPSNGRRKNRSSSNDSRKKRTNRSSSNESRRSRKRSSSNDSKKRGGRIGRRKSSGSNDSRKKRSPQRRRSTSDQKRSRSKENNKRSKSKRKSKSKKAKKPSGPEVHFNKARISVFMNGNKVDQGFDIFISERYHPTWFKVLDAISDRSPVARPVYHLYTDKGKEVKEVRQLKDMETYVAAYVKNEPFVRMDYGRKTNWEKSSTIAHKDPKPLISDESMVFYEYVTEKSKGNRSARSSSRNRRSR